jgi:hypothetical protein
MRTSTSRSPSAWRSTPSSSTARSSTVISSLICARSCRRCSVISRAAPSTYSVSSAVSASSRNAGRQLVEERALGRRQRRVGQALGEHPRAEAEADELLVEVRVAQAVRPGSTGRSKVKIRFETPPVEVMITTISTCGWSVSTSTWPDRRGLDRRRGDDRRAGS